MDGVKILTRTEAIAEMPRAGAMDQGRSGEGRIELECLGQQTRVVRSISHQPLKLLAPRTQGPTAAIYATTFGGGLVAGDSIQIDVSAGPRTTALFTTQSATKVFRSVNGRGCRQSLHATLADDAFLAVWPDPIICFTGAIYDQRQQFDLAPTASLLLVDALSSGRRARGERWAFSRYQSRNQIRINDKLALTDAMTLDESDGPIDAPFRGGRFECLATVILIGPAIEPHAVAILQAAQSAPLQRRAATLCSASRIPTGLILRLLGPTTEHVTQTIRTLLTPITALLGHDPWTRKW
jgi:urease accessory protein